MQQIIPDCPKVLKKRGSISFKKIPKRFLTSNRTINKIYLFSCNLRAGRGASTLKPLNLRSPGRKGIFFFFGDHMFFMKIIRPLAVLTIMSAALSAQSEIKNDFIDPEVQNYFETVYGYKNPAEKKGSFRDAPISMVNQGTSIKNLPAVMGKKYSSSAGNSSDSLPLYYSVKNAYSSGPLSSCVIEPDEISFGNLKKFVLTEVRTSASNSEKVYSRILLPSGFVLGGEETIKAGKQEDRVFIGWLPSDNLSSIMGNSMVKSVYLSRRKDLKAPMTEINLVIKAPVDRDPALFAEAFEKQVAGLGFVARDIKNIKAGPNARFYLVEIKGGMPIDKTEQLLSNPFVLKLGSGI